MAGESPFQRRLFSRRVGAMLARNTVVSTSVFAVDLAILWLFVAYSGLDKLGAAALGLIAANTLHYALGRTWIFKGTMRGVALGYAYFLINAAIGMAVTMLLYAAFVQWTSVNYLIARVLVSVIAGLTVFLLNATLNFRRV